MPEGRGHRMLGGGTTVVPVNRRALWKIVMDEQRLAAAIPGAETLHRADQDGRQIYAADVGIGVGFLKGTFRVTADFVEAIEPTSIVLFGGARGSLGNSSGEGWIDFEQVEGGTRVTYTYAILITGAVAAAGGRLLDTAANTLIDKFFQRLARSVREERKQRRAAQA